MNPLTISSFVPDPVPPSNTHIPHLDLADVLSSACELANSRASKILAVRSEQHTQLSLTEFVELFKENWNFVVASEKLAKRMIVSLRGVTASQVSPRSTSKVVISCTQARTFLMSYHAVRLTKSARLVEEEQWTQVDVSNPTQHTVKLLIDSAVADPSECIIPALTAPHTNGNVSEPGKMLNVEDKTFYVVKATAESLVLVGDYLSIVINLELVVTDVMSRIVEFLKVYPVY